MRIDIILFFLLLIYFVVVFLFSPPPCPRCLRSPSFPSYFSLRFLVIFFSSWICTKRYIPLLFFRSHITKRTHTIFVTISPPTILILVIKPILEKKKIAPYYYCFFRSPIFNVFFKKKENTHFHHWQLTSKNWHGESSKCSDHSRLATPSGLTCLTYESGALYRCTIKACSNAYSLVNMKPCFLVYNYQINRTRTSASYITW